MAKKTPKPTSVQTHAASVMARNNWPGTFKRTVFEQLTDRETGKTARGKALEQLVFAPGVPVDLTAEQYEAVKGDIGVALVEIDYDEKGRPRVVPDAGNAEVVSDLQAAVAQQAATIKTQQEAIDLLREQVIELGGKPVVDFTDESISTDFKA